jgi:hypothetical protein
MAANHKKVQKMKRLIERAVHCFAFALFRFRLWGGMVPPVRSEDSPRDLRHSVTNERISKQKDIISSLFLQSPNGRKSERLQYALPDVRSLLQY